MQHTSKKLGLLTALLLGSTALTGCTGLNGLMPIASDTKVDAQFWKDNMPAYKVGMKWVYKTTVETTGVSPITSEWSKEITQVDGTTATVHTVNGSVVSDEAVTPETMINGGGNLTVSTNDSMVSSGTEDVTVPFQTYKGATKLSVSATSAASTAQTTIWVAKGVGVVKTMTVSGTVAASSSVTTVLSNFIAP